LQCGATVKATIYDLVLGARLRDVVPPAYRDAATADVRPDGVYSVLLFDHAERDVVPSPPVLKALRRVKSAAPDGIVAVGTVFTEEALGLLAGAGARVVSFARARQL
jgi:hypothetical protein